MGKSADTPIPLILRLEPIRGYLLIGVLCLGLMFTLAERFRPGLIEPWREGFSTAAGTYFHPLLQGTKGAQRMTRKVSELWGVQGEFDAIKSELEQVRLELQLTREELRRVGRIAELKKWNYADGLVFRLADVIGFSAKGRSAEWIIGLGSADGVEVNAPAVGREGLAGVVREVSNRSARLQALTDPMSAVGVAAAKGRGRGIVFGRGRGAPLEFVPEDETVAITVGEVLVTSGFENSIYPKGLVVGRITARRTNFRGLEYGVVEPAEKFNTLEEVLVIQRTPEAEPEKSGTGLYDFDLSSARGEDAPLEASPSPSSDSPAQTSENE